MELLHGAATNVGLVREVNEDAFLAAPPLFVVADGMGGHEGGDVASAIVVEEFEALARRGHDPARAADDVAHTMEACQRRIEAYADQQRAAGIGPFSAGTTAVVAVVVEREGRPAWMVTNVGDSRAYRLHGGALHQVSVDHSVVQDLVESGAITREAAAHHPERHVITRALGGTHRSEPDVFWLPLEAADRLLLCTDGITDMISDAEVLDVLEHTPDPVQAADALVAAALRAGGRDNATAVVVDLQRDREAVP